MSGALAELRAELDEARRALREQQKRPAIEGEPMATWSTSIGPVQEPRRVADALVRWMKAKTALRDALRAHDPGDEDRT